MARASSKDVAERAGVSIATVSHVINHTRFVSEETRQKVLDAIKDLNYRPNAIARGLVTNSTNKIGLVVSDITNPFFTAITRGVEDGMISHRYNTIVCNTDEDPQREENYLHLLATQQIDGLIIAPTGAASQSLTELTALGIPIVQIDRKAPQFEAPLVTVNNEQGAYEAIRHLIGLGHRKIAYLMGIGAVSTQIERLNGWKRALQEAGLPADNDLIIQADPRFYGTVSSSAAPLDHPKQQKMPNAYEVLQQRLHLPDRPSALFVATNQLTLGALYAFKDGGLRCPEHISLVSFDDHDWAPLFQPPLTVVRQPTYQIGYMAAQLMMRIMAGEHVESPEPLPVELIVRGSTGPPPVMNDKC